MRFCGMMKRERGDENRRCHITKVKVSVQTEIIPGLSLKLAYPTNAVANLCLERAHTGSSVAAGIMGVKISAKPDLDRDMG